MSVQYKRRREELNYSEEKSPDFSKSISYTVIKQLLEKELHCAICHEIVIFSSVLHCGHIFCTYCIHVWLKHKPKCPLCFKPCHRHVSLKILDNFIEEIYDLFMPKCLQIERCKEIESRQKITDEAEIDKNSSSEFESGSDSQLTESDFDSTSSSLSSMMMMDTSTSTTSADTTSSSTSFTTDASYSSM
ncbi:unnamed protein product [Trichobilharzia regenti]|uniref:RING-type domain-containing protein n=1 Tax=Trichobilharzia regenti TaxID=157069 RepID=A0A183WCX7_TRIRE|nr:unnamed protein product [Trichobilharzia regenti]VDQ05861.1 unnamed protein product [Trichobilharzia regenti]